MVLIAKVIIINGKHILIHLVKDMWCPNFTLNATGTTPALDPIKVPLPPKSAPNARAHHNGLNWKPLALPNEAAIVGSPINVAAQSIFETKTWTIINGIDVFLTFLSLKT